MRSKHTNKYSCGKRKSNTKVDRRFTQLLPPHKLAGEELNTYIERLRTEGGPTLYVWKEKNILLDNFFEFELCKKHGIPYHIIYVNLATVEEAKRWIIDTELQRRHLSKWQRCVLVINHFRDYYDALAKENQQLSKGRGKKGRKKTVSQFKKIDVNEQLAQKAHVSRDTIIKVNYILTKGKAEDFEKAESESKSINAVNEDIKHRKRHDPPPTCTFRNDLVKGVIDNVICKKAVEGLNMLPDEIGTIGLVSPNFNCGRIYPDGVPDDIPNDEHLENLRKTFTALLPKLRKGGRCVIEYQEIRSRQEEEKKLFYARPVHMQIVSMMLGIGYKYLSTIIWDKDTVGRSLAKFGEYLSPSSPRLRTQHSYLFVFCKDDFTLECETGYPSTLSKKDFLRLSKTVWHVKPETHGYGSNRCPMPVRLAEDVIKLFSFREDVVIDCYGGSGTTAIAALRQNRHFIHIDCSQTCCADAKERIEKEMKTLNKTNAKKAA